VKSIADRMVAEPLKKVAEPDAHVAIEKDVIRQVGRLEKEMLQAAKNLEFEKAAELRDSIAYLKRKNLGVA
jgi:excinuclease ABC subunit B